MSTRGLVLLESFELGGAERQAVHLASRWDAVVGASAVAAWGPPGPTSRLCDDQRVRWVSLGRPPRTDSARSICIAALRTARRIRSMDVDVVLPYTVVPNLMASLGRAVHRAPVVWGQRDEGTRRVPLQRPAARRADAWVANSEGGRRHLSTLGVTLDEVAVVPNFLSPEDAVSPRAAWRSRLAVPDDHVAVVMLANFHHGKDHDTLLRAWATLPDRLRGRGTLVLAGRDDGRERALRTLAADLRIADGTRFAGPVTDVAGLLAAADVLAHSSGSEGMPNAVMEAMAAGLAVVGTDIAALRDCLGPAYPAELLAPPGDAHALGEALAALLGDAARRRAIGSGNACRSSLWRDPESTLDRVIATAMSVSSERR